MVEKVVGRVEKYIVVIGNEVYEVEGSDNLNARYEAATRFRRSCNLNIPLGLIVEHARARVIPNPEPSETTKQVLKALGVEDDS